jgi:hypothetical protein
MVGWQTRLADESAFLQDTILTRFIDSQFAPASIFPILASFA